MEWSKPKKPTNDDMLVMYFVVREELGMGAGKVGAQCAHACQLILMEQDNIRKQIRPLSDSQYNILRRMNYWNSRDLNGGFRKVVLKASDKEWASLKDIYDPIIVCDAGLTEVEPGSETVMALWPIYKNERDKVLKRLRCLT